MVICGKHIRQSLVIGVLIVLLSGCFGGETPDLMEEDGEIVDMNKRESILGGSGFSIGGEDKPKINDQGSNGVGVNAFLWRATLDTMSIWPISSADPFGGVIITDWYAPPATPNEQFKIQIYILDRALRADGIRVSVFRRIQVGPGNWREAPVQAATATQLEDAILTRARQFRNRDR